LKRWPGPVLTGALDTTQDVEHEVVRALTGGEGEGVLEFKQKGTGKDGKFLFFFSLS
jgi:hypothetical protein